MKKVYFYLMYYYNGDSIDECWQSKNFNTIEEAFESKERQGSKTSPVMEGWVKEDEVD